MKCVVFIVFRISFTKSLLFENLKKNKVAFESLNFDESFFMLALIKGHVQVIEEIYTSDQPFDIIFLK